MIQLPQTCLSFINGQYSSIKATANIIPNIYPGTNQQINEVVYADQDDLKQAVASSADAFKHWSAMPVAQRSDILLKAAGILRSRVTDLAEMEVWDTGKPIHEALTVDVITAADALEYFAKVALAYEDAVIPNHGALIYTTREPLGVCVGIGAWNYPLQIACWKAAPALVMGNTMIYKPSEMTPMSAMKLAEIFIEAGMPPGVFNVIQGDGEVAQQLLSLPGIAKISFTGSVPTGRKIAAVAAKNLTPVTLELGGKSPLIIFDDADIGQAVIGSMLANFYTQGEICSNGTRVFVAEKICNDFLGQLQKRVETLKIGDPFDKQTQVGSLISTQHLDKVMGYIDAGKKAGAKLICGGERVTQSPLDKGNFVAPTVFADCTDEMSIVRDEIFGPVMSVLTFKDEDEVVARANDTNYGLASGIFTSHLKRAHRVAKQLQAGVCWINNYNITPTPMPFGGYKHSGLGRENGLMTLAQYTQTKCIYVELNDIEHSY